MNRKNVYVTEEDAVDMVKAARAEISAERRSPAGVEAFSGEALSRIVSEALAGIKRERFLTRELEAYLNDESDKGVCCLCGLRGTGKSTMMFQAIRRLGAENCVYFECDEGSTVFDLKKLMNHYTRYKYVFIELLTSPDWFIEESEFLAADYAAKGTKIVLSGDNSLCFCFAGYHSLVNALRTIRTTFISADEYAYLKDADRSVCTRNGGSLYNFILSDNCMTSLKYYIGYAAADNIVHSLDNFGSRKKALLYELQDAAPYDLRTFITDTVITQSVWFMNKYGIPLAEDAEVDYLNDYPCGSEAEKLVLGYLEMLDFIHKLPDTGEYAFTQCGMRFYTVCALADKRAETAALIERCAAEEAERLRLCLEEKSVTE